MKEYILLPFKAEMIINGGNDDPPVGHRSLPAAAEKQILFLDRLSWAKLTKS